MEKEIIFSMSSSYRDDFRIVGYRFGSGKKSLAIIGSMRGDEIQQLYTCSQIINHLKQLETEGKIAKGHEILVIPSANPFSMNIEKRFWAMDNTDINRMFPGYEKGETTQRIAAAIFNALQGYTYGIQMGSFYIPGDFIPHVRMLETGYEDTQTAALFGLPFVSTYKPLPFDTTLLNYNWQIWGTKAFSIYGGQTNHIESQTSLETLDAIFRFMQKTELIKIVLSRPGYNSVLLKEENLINLKSPASGILYKTKTAHNEVKKGDLLARIINPYEGCDYGEIRSPLDGVIFFAHNKPLVMQGDMVYRIWVP